MVNSRTCTESLDRVYAEGLRNSKSLCLSLYLSLSSPSLSLTLFPGPHGLSPLQVSLFSFSIRQSACELAALLATPHSSLWGAWPSPSVSRPQVPACVLSHLSHVQLFATLWAVARQAHLSMGFSRQEHWSGLPCPPGGLPLGSNPCLFHLLHWQVGSFLSAPPGEPYWLPRAAKRRDMGWAGKADPRGPTPSSHFSGG